jgi:hypothetical protein
MAMKSRNLGTLEMEILVEVLTAKPVTVYEALARLMPWQNLATKDDLRRLEEKMATKDNLKKLEEKVATKEELRAVETSLREEIRRVETSLREEIGKVEESLREDIRRLWLALNALGARWGCSARTRLGAALGSFLGMRGMPWRGGFTTMIGATSTAIRARWSWT